MPVEVRFDDEHGVARVKMTGAPTVSEVSTGLDEVEEMLKDRSPKLILSDLTGQKTGVDKETRQVIKEKGMAIGFDRHAFVGVSPATRMVAKVLMAVLGQSKKTKFFGETDRALEWLTEIR
jgi:hypothetical protein